MDQQPALTAAGAEGCASEASAASENAIAPGPADPSTLFVLRVWPKADGLRISARAAADAAPTWIEPPASLLDYLARRCAESESAAGPEGSASGRTNEPDVPFAIQPQE